MFGQPKRYAAKYLGGHPDYSKSKSLHLVLSAVGIEARSIVLNKLLFTIRWDHIVDLGQNLNQSIQSSAIGDIATGLGMIGSAQGQGLGAYSLQSFGQNQKVTVTEHFLEIKYSIEGITGLAQFEFDSNLFNKRPVLTFISEVNKTRISNKKSCA